MKPPKEKFIGYTDKEWLEIKRVLARVGVDADTALVNQQPLRAAAGAATHTLWRACQ
jgi:hypothetical protein